MPNVLVAVFQAFLLEYWSISSFPFSELSLSNKTIWNLHIFYSCTKHESRTTENPPVTFIFYFTNVIKFLR